MKLWVEKYRPLTLDEIVSQSKTIRRLKDLVKTGHIPHMIFTGPSGNGKSSTALALVHDFYSIHHPDLRSYNDLIFIRNASDEMRMSKGDLDALKEFVKSGTFGKPLHKFVILEESDRMSQDVQRGLRRIMENVSGDVHFIFTNNYIENMIDPLISRCAVYRFYPVKKEDALSLAERIFRNEGVSFDNKNLDKIYTFSRGDLRKFINALQVVSVNGGKGALDFFGIYSDEEMDMILDESTGIKEIMQLASKNVTPSAVLYQMLITFLKKGTDKRLISLLGDFDMRFAKKSDMKIQMMALLSSIRLAIGGTEK